MTRGRSGGRQAQIMPIFISIEDHMPMAALSPTICETTVELQPADKWNLRVGSGLSAAIVKLLSRIMLVTHALRSKNSLHKWTGVSYNPPVANMRKRPTFCRRASRRCDSTGIGIERITRSVPMFMPALKYHKNPFGIQWPPALESQKALTGMQLKNALSTVQRP